MFLRYALMSRLLGGSTGSSARHWSYRWATSKKKWLNFDVHKSLYGLRCEYFIKVSLEKLCMRLSFLMVMERMLLRQVLWIHTGRMVGQGGRRAIWVLLCCARVWLGTLQHLLHSEFSEQWSLLYLICYGFVSHGEVISYQSAKIDPKLDL